MAIINRLSFVISSLQDSTLLQRVHAPPIIFGATSLSAGLITIMLPETRGKPLPDFINKETSEQEEELVIVEDRNEVTGYTSTV